VDGIIGKLWGRALESGQVIPGMDPLTFGADGIAVTAGAYATTAEGVNVTSSLGSWFHFLPAEGAGESQGEGVNAAIVALDTALVGVKDYEGENTAFVSDGVSVSLKNREGSEGSGLDLSQGVVFSIPFSERSEALRNGTTLDWYGHPSPLFTTLCELTPLQVQVRSGHRGRRVGRGRMRSAGVHGEGNHLSLSELYVRTRRPWQSPAGVGRRLVSH
jgi:hypothetical protein